MDDRPGGARGSEEDGDDEGLERLRPLAEEDDGGDQPAVVLLVGELGEGEPRDDDAEKDQGFGWGRGLTLGVRWKESRCRSLDRHRI